jgi:hypothetical protein
MFGICVDGVSCLSRIEVILLKSTEGANVANGRHNKKLSKFSSNGKNIPAFFIYVFMCVTSASTLRYSHIVYVSVVKDLEEKVRIYICIDLTEGFMRVKWNDFSLHWTGLFKYIN